MNKITFYALFFLQLFPCIAWSQLELPAASPRAGVSQRIGLTNVSIEYGSPAVRNRKIWGAMIPYNKLWRTGANECTTIELSNDASIAGKLLAAGKYSLFTIPGEKEWTVVINRNSKLWGTIGYDEKEDVLRFKVSPSPTAEHHERLQFSITADEENTGSVSLVWEKLKVVFPVETEVEARAVLNIKKALGQDENRWLVLAEAASFYSTHKMDQEQAVRWVDESIQLKIHFYNHWIKGRVLAAQKNYKEAVKLAEESLKIGEANPDEFFKEDKPIIEKDLQGWKKLML